MGLKRAWMWGGKRFLKKYLDGGAKGAFKKAWKGEAKRLENRLGLGAKWA